MKTWVIGILVFLLWSAGSTYWYVAQVKGIGWASDAGPSAFADLGAGANAKAEPNAFADMGAGDSATTDAGSDATIDNASTPSGDLPPSNNVPSSPTKKPTALPADIAEPHTVLFAFAGPSPENPAAFEAYLDGVASYLKSHANQKALVRGYTDDTAARENNIKLSQRRCDVIVGKLQERGVTTTQIVTEPLGEADPVATNDTPEGRRLNRRVVISIQH